MPEQTATSDQELVKMLSGSRQASSAAFSELYDRHAPRIYAYCRRILSNEEAARDAFQEAFMRFYETARKGQTIEHAPAFLLRIARNLCLNDIRKHSKTMIEFSEFDFPTTDQSYERTEFLALLDAAIETLANEQREALLLKEYGGMSYRDIAEVCGESLTSVRSRIYRAKKALREILAPYINDLMQ